MKETIRDFGADYLTPEGDSTTNALNAGETQPQPGATVKKHITAGSGTLWHWLKPK